ncbi:MAG: ribosome biogenesis GTPase YlqF [Clostridia bacterium]|nr:ribosome biogenesis GTPase YlqF [Clostridia bacterium]
MEINWYPGHMAKAKRELQEQLKKVDVVVEVLDARIPHSSRNPDLARMCAHKKRLMVLGKSDLADPEMTKAWVEYYRGTGVSCIHAEMNRDAKRILSAIEREARESVDRAMERGIRKTVRVMVAGVPNAGKSTLINRLNGQSVAKVGDRPGVTRSTRWVKVGPYLEMMDTPGLLWPRLDDPDAARRLCYTSAIKDDVVDTYALATHLMEDLLTAVPKAASERFHLKDPALRGQEMMDAVCVGRGFLMKGGVPDLERCCRVILDEYRGGKLGRITLEAPPCADTGKADENNEEGSPAPSEGTDGNV